MSAYNPPTQNQSIFNPNNYGTAISTLADSSYDEITATLGNFTTLFIGTDNVATTLNGKQDTIDGDTQFDSFNVLSNINFLQDESVGSAYFPLSYTTISSISTPLATRKEFENRVYYAYPTYPNGTIPFTWYQSSDSIGDSLAVWSFEYNLQNALHYMEFDMTLDNPIAGTNNSSNSDLLLTITSSIGTGTTLTKSYTYGNTNENAIGSSRFRMVMKLNSATAGDYDGQMINGVSRGVVSFTLAVSSSSTGGTFSFDRGGSTNPASLRISSIRDGETIFNTPYVN